MKSIFRLKQANINTNELFATRKLDLALYPTSHIYVEIMRWSGHDSKLGHTLGIRYENHILTLIKPNRLNVFTFFHGFDIYSWISMLIAIVLISCYKSFIENSLLTFLNSFWRYLAVLLSEPFPKIDYKKAIKSVHLKIILIIWLLSCTVLLASFSGVLLKYFITSLQSDVIDTFEQLYANKELSIISDQKSYFSRFVEKNQNNREDMMSQDFIRRLTYVDITEKINDILRMINTGSIALVLDKTRLDYIFKGYESRFHISKYGLITTPYSFQLSPYNTELENNINLMYVKMD
jgi:hypothetical protein